MPASSPIPVPACCWGRTATTAMYAYSARFSRRPETSHCSSKIRRILCNPLGYVEGSMLPGGTISLLANKGFVLTDPGSLVNVSGAVATFDIVGTNGVTQATVGASAGTINIDAREGIVLQGNLLAQPASLNGTVVAGAPGGTLNVDLGYGYNDSGPNGTGANNETSGSIYPTATRVLTIAGTGPDGAPAVPPSNQLLSGTGVIDVSTIQNGGFGNSAIESRA